MNANTLKNTAITAAMLTIMGSAAMAESHKKSDGEMAKKPIAEACLENVRELELRVDEEGIQLARETRQDIRVLRDAAVTFAHNNNEEACEEMIEEINELKEQKVDEQEAKMEREQRRERLSDSRPLNTEGHLVWTDGIIGDEVVNLQNEELGQVEDVAISPGSDGQVYVMVSHGGFLGLGETLTPIRMSDLKQTADEDTLVLNVDAEKFEEAPEVEFDEKARMTAEAWSADIKTWWDRNITAD